MIKRFTFLLLIIVNLSGCITANFDNSTEFKENKKVSRVYVIVVGDKQSEDCLNYYKNFLIDSLKTNNIQVDGMYECCVNNKTDLNEYMHNLLSNKDFTSDHILTAVIKEVVVGHGTSSSRRLQLNLFDTTQKTSLWSGELFIMFSWFINDQHYRDVANKLNETTLTELRNKKII